MESGKLFARALSEERIFDVFEHIIRCTLDSQDAVISSFEPHENLIRCRFVVSNGERLDPAGLPPIAFTPTPGTGMQSEVIRTGEARLFCDLPQRVQEGRGKFYDVTKEKVKELPKGSVPNTKCALMAPVKLDGDVIGVVQVMSDVPNRYDDRHLVFLEGLALQIGAALKNAELFGRMQEEIAERTRAEEALRAREDEVRKLNAELEDRVAERTEAFNKAIQDMEGFCYSVSHDLRAPLRGISGAAMMLLEDYSGKLDREGKAHLDQMRAAAKKMSDLIDGLLKFSRLGRTEMQPVELDLSHIASRIVIALSMHTGLNPEVVIQPGLTAFGDQQMVTMALENLLSNAFKFSSKADEPKIEFGAADLDAKPLSSASPVPSGSTPENRRVFFIKDNGVGFEQEYVSKLFRPFERLHRESDFPGTGIGLANVKRVIERHGGEIWAESEPGKGATFYFTFG